MLNTIQETLASMDKAEQLKTIEQINEEMAKKIAEITGEEEVA